MYWRRILCTLHIAVDCTILGVGMSDMKKIQFVPLHFPVMGANPLQGPLEGEGGRELLRNSPAP